MRDHLTPITWLLAAILIAATLTLAYYLSTIPTDAPTVTEQRITR